MTRIIKDIAYARYQAPDLAAMEKFLVDFGMQVAARTPTALYMRGYGESPVVHVTELAEESRGIGLGLTVASEAAFQKLSRELNAKIETNTEPGGGQVIHVTDPAGFRVDLLFGQTPAAVLPTRPVVEINTQRRIRNGRSVRLEAGPAKVMRLGHAVMISGDFRAHHDFYTKHFGFRASDYYYTGSKDRPMFAFLHVGSGDDYTDHHTIAVGQVGPPISRFDHTAFEVLDWDDMVTGNEHMHKVGYQHAWGVGRHILGSQIFDYWRDPFRNKIEHFTDTDMVNDHTETGMMEFGGEALHQWAPPLNPEFFT